MDIRKDIFITVYFIVAVAVISCICDEPPTTAKPIIKGLPFDHFEDPEYGKVEHGLELVKNIQIQSKHILWIEDFNYDGTGPYTLFIGGKGEPPPSYVNKSGVAFPGDYVIADENGHCGTLDKYINKEIKLTLPKDVAFGTDIEWVAVYDSQYERNFGQLNITGRMTTLKKAIPDDNAGRDTKCDLPVKLVNSVGKCRTLDWSKFIMEKNE